MLFHHKSLIVSYPSRTLLTLICIFASGQEAKVVKVWEIWIQVYDQVLIAALAAVSP